MIAEKVSQGAKDKFGVVEGKEISKEKLSEIKKDTNFMVSEKSGKIIIKEKLQEKKNK